MKQESLPPSDGLPSRLHPDTSRSAEHQSHQRHPDHVGEVGRKRSQLLGEAEAGRFGRTR